MYMFHYLTLQVWYDMTTRTWLKHKYNAVFSTC